MPRSFGVELEYRFSPQEKGAKEALKAAAKATRTPTRDLTGPNRPRVKDSRAWTLKWDDGAEFTTPAFKRISSLRKGLKALMPGVLNVPLHTVARRFDMGCGMHVHVSIKGIASNVGKLLTLLLIYIEAEQHFFALQPKARDDTDWCRSIRKGVLQRVAELKGRNLFKEREWEKTSLGSRKKREISAILNWVSSKGVSLNMSPRNSYGTVEFRRAQTTTSWEDAVAWATVCRDFVTASIRFMRKSKGIPKFPTFESFLRFIDARKNLRDWCLQRVDLMSRRRSS